MDARTRDIERAWLQHDPSRGKIPSESWRALRNFKRSLAPQAARVGAASDDGKRIKALMFDYSRKGDVGAQRTLPSYAITSIRPWWNGCRRASCGPGSTLVAPC
jgi:hypothetical protein